MVTWDESSAVPITGLPAAREAAYRHNARCNDPAEQRAFAARFAYLNPCAGISSPPRFTFDGRPITESEFFSACYREGFSPQVIADLMPLATTPTFGWFEDAGVVGTGSVGNVNDSAAEHLAIQVAHGREYYPVLYIESGGNPADAPRRR